MRTRTAKIASALAVAAAASGVALGAASPAQAATRTMQICAESNYSINYYVPALDRYDGVARYGNCDTFSLPTSSTYTKVWGVDGTYLDTARYNGGTGGVRIIAGRDYQGKKAIIVTNFGG